MPGRNKNNNKKKNLKKQLWEKFEEENLRTFDVMRGKMKISKVFWATLD